MRKMIASLYQSQTTIFGSRRERIERPRAEKQSPETLFITCSDAPINPNRLTQTEPGELLILRNAANIAPPYGAA